MIDGNNSLPQLPEGWVGTKLSEISEIILGQSPPSSTYNEDGNGLPFYQGKLEFGDVYPTARKWCSSPKKIAERRDVLISVRAPVGPTNICPDKSCIGRGLAAIRPLDGIGSNFMLYLLRGFEDVLVGQGTGTTFNAITGNQLRTFAIPLPPLPEQHRIVAKIEELFTRLDAGVDALNKIKLQLKGYRQAVLKYAFEGKLTKEWREAHKSEVESASMLLEKIKAERAKIGKYKELSPMDASSLPELPEVWTWARVGDLYDIIGGGTPSTSRPEYWDGDIPWITSADIYGVKEIRPRKTITRVGIENSATNLVPAGSLIVVTRVGLGKIAITGSPLCFSQDSQALVGNNSLINPVYSLYYLSKEVQRFKYEHRGTTIAGVTKKQLAELTFALPPLAEQQNIVEEIERCFSVADAIEKDVEQSLKQAERLRQSILKRAFEGKLVPQDPTDEPAEKLLEHIRAERARIEAEKKATGKTRRI